MRPRSPRKRSAWRSGAAFGHLRNTWETLAQADPLWAVCSDPDRRGRGWGTDEVLASGRAEVRTMLSHLTRCGIDVDRSGRALDFGSGVGRLTQALADEFDGAVGVDISHAMIEKARALNRLPSRCEFILNVSEGLSLFATDSFVFVYSSIVLQHMPPRLAVGYIEEFVRTVRPGGLIVFQVPERHAGRPAARVVDWLRPRLRIRSRLRSLARGSADVAMKMHCVPETRVRATLERAGAEVLDMQWTNSTREDFNGELRYLVEAPTDGYVSRQYCARKVE